MRATANQAGLLHPAPTPGERPVHHERRADQVFLSDRAEIAAVVAVLGVVPQHQIIAGAELFDTPGLANKYLGIILRLGQGVALITPIAFLKESSERIWIGYVGPINSKIRRLN